MSPESLKFKYLFAPGPVLTSERVKHAVLNPDLCHRRHEFERIYHSLRKQITNLFGGDDRFTSVIVTGSGTAANECVLSSVLKPSEEALVVSNGEFGERLARILRIHGIKTHLLAFDWGQSIEIGQVEKKLAQTPAIRLVAVVFHETSTGMINPVKEIGLLAREHGKLFFVDAISAIGGEEVHVVEQEIDFCTGVPNKAVGGLPGISFICLRREALDSCKEAARRNDYLNLQDHVRIADHSLQTPHTPAVQLFIALKEALDELFEEGLDQRIERYRRCAQILRRGIRGLGLQTLVPDEIASNTVTSVFLPRSIPLEKFIDNLDEAGFVVYPGKGPLKEQNLFQVANMGQIDEKACQEFLIALRACLREFGYRAMGTLESTSS